MSDLAEILAGVPDGLRDPLLQSYQEIARNYAEHRWEPSELNGGKFCEAVYSVIEGNLKGSYAAKPSKPSDMVKACRALEAISPVSTRVGDRSLRILIPRMIQPLYEIRNNRGVGHSGGEVDPNFMDATAVYTMASWILAELIRIYHSVSTQEAQEIVDSLVERKHPLIWEVEGIRRVLDPSMPKRDQTLLLLYSRPAWVAEVELAQCVEYARTNAFRQRILMPLHKARLIEYDQVKKRARISPTGSHEVEQKVLKTRV